MARALWFPGADAKVQRKPDRPVMDGIDKLVLHTTESRGWPGYPANFPTITYNPWADKGKRWRQHIPINQAATTLKNDGSNQTNRLNVVQIEIVAYCDPKFDDSFAYVKNLTNEHYRELAEFLVWLQEEWEMPLSIARTWKAHPDSYGTAADNGIRFSWRTYAAFKGILGHQHVPGNLHGDPGSLDVGRLMVQVSTVIEERSRPNREPVDDEQIKAASKFLLPETAKFAAAAATAERLPYWLLCAILEKETGTGRNIYGNDATRDEAGNIIEYAALSGYPHEVDESNYKVYDWLVNVRGMRSNGVGPGQITHKSLHDDMKNRGLRAWVPQDNIRYTAKLLRTYLTETLKLGMSVEERVKRMGQRYSGKVKYGEDLWPLAVKWYSRVGGNDNKTFKP